jgi:hypothetical protein
MYINLKAMWSWTPSRTRSQTPGFQFGLDIIFVVRVFLTLQHLLDVPQVLHDPLFDS